MLVVMKVSYLVAYLAEQMVDDLAAKKAVLKV